MPNAPRERRRGSCPCARPQRRAQSRAPARLPASRQKAAQRVLSMLQPASAKRRLRGTMASPDGSPSSAPSTCLRSHCRASTWRAWRAACGCMPGCSCRSALLSSASRSWASVGSTLSSSTGSRGRRLFSSCHCTSQALTSLQGSTLPSTTSQMCWNSCSSRWTMSVWTSVRNVASLSNISALQLGSSAFMAFKSLSPCSTEAFSSSRAPSLLSKAVLSWLRRSSSCASALLRPATSLSNACTHGSRAFSSLCCTSWSLQPCKISCSTSSSLWERLKSLSTRVAASFLMSSSKRAEFSSAMRRPVRDRASSSFADSLRKTSSR
mmetsp:Transcript_39868/g.126773  ORF Transcript_39868/g.126773 Transcript_39868/m.126773 type:complete len:323 (+) Transcript_39868:130-1098(+)